MSFSKDMNSRIVNVYFLLSLIVISFYVKQWVENKTIRYIKPIYILVCGESSIGKAKDKSCNVVGAIYRICVVILFIAFN